MHGRRDEGHVKVKFEASDHPVSTRLLSPMFAILNFAKINNGAMTQNWEMEVDWVKYETRQ